MAYITLIFQYADQLQEQGAMWSMGPDQHIPAHVSYFNVFFNSVITSTHYVYLCTSLFFSWETKIQLKSMFERSRKKNTFKKCDSFFSECKNL